MKKIGIEDLIKSVPYSIRMELLKKQLTGIYIKEANMLENIKASDKDFYNVGYYSQDELCNRYTIGASNVFDSIDTFLKTLEKAELPDDMMLELYQWAKNNRKSMNLRDNLFNLFEGYINRYRDYEALNEELNGRKTL